MAQIQLPSIPMIYIKAALFLHILLVSLAFIGFAGGGFYLYLNLLLFVLLLLHVYFPSHTETAPLALATDLISIVHDAVALGVFFPGSHLATINWFSYFCAVANLAFRFVSSLLLYRVWVAQSGKEGGTVIQVTADQGASQP